MGKPTKSARDQIMIAPTPMVSKQEHVQRDPPPNKVTWYKHIQQANFQAAIHRRSLECRSDIPSPINHGWKIAGDAYEVDWMTLPPAPETILELVN